MFSADFVPILLLLIVIQLIYQIHKILDHNSQYNPRIPTQHQTSHSARALTISDEWLMISD